MEMRWIKREKRASQARQSAYLKGMEVFYKPGKREAQVENQCFKYGIESLQGLLVYIILIMRHKVIANKRVTAMGYYFRGRGKKPYFHPIMGHIQSLFPIMGSFSGNYGLLYPIDLKKR